MTEIAMYFAISKTEEEQFYDKKSLIDFLVDRTGFARKIIEGKINEQKKYVGPYKIHCMVA